MPRVYELFVNGAWIQPEGGRVRTLINERGQTVARVPHATTRDLDRAVAAARQAGGSWSDRSAFQRGQVLFRMAELLEDHAPRLVNGLVDRAGHDTQPAATELARAADRLFHWAGWTDKFASVLGGVNPVAAPFVNFTRPEPGGVVVVVAPSGSPILGLITLVAPILVSGSTVVAVVDHEAPTLALDWAETLPAAGTPPGVVNVLTGERAELVTAAARHAHVHALVHPTGNRAWIEAIEQGAAAATKRLVPFPETEPETWSSPSHESLDRIRPFLVWKTTWHPTGA